MERCVKILGYMGRDCLHKNALAYQQNSKITKKVLLVLAHCRELFSSTSFGQKLFDRQHLADRHLADRHLADRHLADRHLAVRFLANRHLADRHLTNRHLADRHLLCI